jgi:hypothetical protein
MVEYFIHKRVNSAIMVKGIAVPAFDNKKNKWGWKALNLENISK